MVLLSYKGKFVEERTLAAG